MHVENFVFPTIADIRLPREKLRVGGSQLVELKETLDRCAEATGHSVALTTCL